MRVTALLMRIAPALLVSGALLACSNQAQPPADLSPAHHPDQHGHPEGHLVGPGAWGDLELVSSLRLTDIEGLIADVAVSPDGKWAFLANWGIPTCAENSEKGGRNREEAGAYVVDISDLENPRRVGFIPHHQDSRPGEGMQVVSIHTKFFGGDMLVMNSEQCGKNGKGGVVLWDVSDPRKPKRLSAHFGDRGFADTNDIHSAFAWQAGERAYVVIVDNFESTDIDILDITNPKRPRLIAEYNLNSYVPAGIDQPQLGLSESFLHDMTVKEIDGRFIMLVSYWDGGFVLLDVTDPRQALYLGDTDYAAVDPVLLERTGISLPPEGNAHQAEFTADNRFFIGTDEDFEPFATVLEHRGQTYRLTRASFGPSLEEQPLAGQVVWVGGTGCTASTMPVAPTGDAVALIQRGECFFQDKAEAAYAQGYVGYIVANDAVRGDALVLMIGRDAGPYPPIPGVFVGYSTGEALKGGIGQTNGAVSASSRFNGWGYVHLFDAGTLQGLDTYAIPEAHDEAYAHGYGDLTVHEVATHPTAWDRAYLAYYAGGMRALRIQCADEADTSTCRLVETGGYLDPEGNNFWGVEVLVRGGQTYVLGSDLDSGLWIFRDTSAP